MAKLQRNQMTEEEHLALHEKAPEMPYDDCERMIRDWIMEYEGYDLFKQILLGNGVTEEELEAVEGIGEDPPDLIDAMGEDRLDAIHVLMQAAEDRAYLIVIIKLYQNAVDFQPQQAGHYRSNIIRPVTHTKGGK